MQTVVIGSGVGCVVARDVVIAVPEDVGEDRSERNAEDGNSGADNGRIRRGADPDCGRACCPWK